MRLWWTSLAWGAGISVIFTLAATGWRWYDNADGLFHGPDGTHWDLVMHTALATALPVFFYASVAAWLVELFRAGVRRLWGRKGW